MAETLTPQEVTALEEMPSVPEMGVLRKITTLQDIPLAEGDNLQQFEPPETNDNDQEETERKLKTNSLKRFFRLSAKKKTGGDGPSLEAQCSSMEYEEEGVLHLNKIQQNPIQNESENSSHGKENKNSKRNPSNYQRSKFGFAVYKSNPPSPANKEQTHKGLPASMSKANLKSSLSSYWNAVFKQKKIKKLTKSNITLTDQEKNDDKAEEQLRNSYKSPEDIEVIPDDNSVLEDVNKLKISEEVQPK